MKHLIIIGLLIVNSLGFAQNELNSSTETSSKYEIHDLGMSVSVDSAEELKSVLTPESITQFTEMATTDETITFELKCNYKNLNENRTFFKSYKIVGSTGNLNDFLKLIEKTKTSALNDYNTFDKK